MHSQEPELRFSRLSDSRCRLQRPAFSHPCDDDSSRNQLMQSVDVDLERIVGQDNEVRALAGLEGPEANLLPELARTR